MPTPLDAPAVFNREFLEVRSWLLQVAAALDRIDRAGGNTTEDARRQNIDRALALLGEDRTDRAEQLQMIFSRSYDPRWREGLPLRRS